MPSIAPSSGEEGANIAGGDFEFPPWEQELEMEPGYPESECVCV